MSVVIHDEPLLHRHATNPILTSRDWPYAINSVFNAGATLLEDGSTLLLCRVEDRRGLSHLCAARSVNGVDGWRIDPTPTLMADPEHYPEELWGIENPRITMDADGDTINVYYGAADCAIALARTSVHSLLEWLDARGNCERRQRAQDL